MIRPLSALALALACALGCAPIQQKLQSEFAPGQLQNGSHIHAYQAAAFAQAFNDGHAASWDARLRAVHDDALPMLEAMRKSPYELELEVVPHMNENASASYEYYDVNAVVAPRSGRGKRFVLPGAQGTDPDAYDRALAPAAAAARVPPETLKKGHFALFALVTMNGELNATDDAMRRYAFGLFCLREKLKRGERADYLAPMRETKESLEDVDYALRVVAGHHEATARWRGEVLATSALVRAYETADGPRLLAEQIDDGRAFAQRWRATHPRPTMQEYGVAMKPFKLPTPDAVLEAFDKDGYVTAAIQVAKGIATGSPSATIEGFGKLAPKNSSLRVASEGVAAAMRGDVSATADAVLALADEQEDVAPIAARLRALKGAVDEVGAGVAEVRGGAAAPKGLGDARKKLDAVEKGAAKVGHGAASAASAAMP